MKTEKEDEMKGYATYQLAKIRQHELIAVAEQFRRVKEARLPADGTVVRARRRLIWLRDAAGGIAARLAIRKGAWGGSH